MLPSENTPALAVLDSHLYKLRNKANERLKILELAGYYFCGSLDAPNIQQYLCNIVLRIPVCDQCHNARYTPQPEDYSKWHD